ncbi:hypothetical protein D3C81_1246940 [compost metagenome]
MLVDQRLFFLLQLGDLLIDVFDFLFDVVVVLLQQLFGFRAVRSGWGSAAQRFIGGFLHVQTGGETYYRDCHQVVSRHIQVPGRLDQPGGHRWRCAGHQYRNIERNCQCAVANVRWEHCRQNRSHHAGKAV